MIIVVLVEVVVDIGLAVSQRLVCKIELKVRRILDAVDRTCPALNGAAVGMTVDKLLVVKVDCLGGLEVVLRPYCLYFLGVADVSDDRGNIVVAGGQVRSSLRLDVLVVAEGLVSEVLSVVVVPESGSDEVILESELVAVAAEGRLVDGVAFLALEVGLGSLSVHPGLTGSVLIVNEGSAVLFDIVYLDVYGSDAVAAAALIGNLSGMKSDIGKGSCGSVADRHRENRSCEQTDDSEKGNNLLN